jgi:iron complex transport system substrate-binding protein
MIFAISVLNLSGCNTDPVKDGKSGHMPALLYSMPLDYATQFSVDYYENGYKLLSFANGDRIFIVPDGADIPSGLDAGTKILHCPVSNIYLAATSAMSLFDSLEILDVIRLSGTQADGWYIDNAKKAMVEGKIVYAGKYNQPDYELITSEKCPLAVESMMIGHASDIKEQLENLGIVVLTDQSSNEPHPLGRAEWIKLYGAIFDKEDIAENAFGEQKKYLDDISLKKTTDKTVAFFYVSSSGRIVVRKSEDYVSKMISLAGGRYAFSEIGDNTTKTSSVTIDPEAFYASAHNADILIYNSTIGSEIGSVEELIEKCELLSDFDAVKNGNVWCTQKNMYQETTSLGAMINSFYEIFSDDSGNLEEVPYLFKLK